MKLLLATTNPGKLREIERMLGDTGIAISGVPAQLGIEPPEETGTTFAENAAAKAAYYALASGLPAMADDSGLEVCALNGEPGVLSARFGGADTSFDEKMRLILDLLSKAETTGNADRSARFVCAAALADPEGNIAFTTQGVCDGMIAHIPRGNGGFGYDPIFIPSGFEKTFGELPPEVKESISHRSKAIKEMLPFLREFFAV